MPQPTPAGVAEADLPLTAKGRVDGRSARKVETRRRIILAASELFAEQGYAGTSMDQIADAAGLSKGTIFYNFKNKADLFEQLVRHAAVTIADQMVQARQGLVGWESLHKVMHTVMVAIDEQPASAQILTTELFRRQRPWAGSLDEARNILMTPLVEILDELADERQQATGEQLMDRSRHGIVAMGLLGAMVVATLDRSAYQSDQPLELVHQVLLRSVSGMRLPTPPKD